jgi:hypothetical protein
MHGQRQSVDARAINEEALLLAKYLRDETKTWIPRVPIFPVSTVVECQVVTHN